MTATTTTQFGMANREALTAYAFRVARFVVGGVVVALLAPPVAGLAERFVAGSGDTVYVVILGIYGLSITANLVVAALTWPRSEAEVSVKLLWPSETEDVGEQIYGKDRGEMLRLARLWGTRGIATLEFAEATGLNPESISLYFVDGTVWVVPIPRATARGTIRAEIAKETMTLYTLRHGQLVGGVVKDVSGSKRRASVELETLPV
jgi:hypothetical protein